MIRGTFFKNGVRGIPRIQKSRSLGDSRNIQNLTCNLSIEARRSYKVLAIESSCDDSCVALLDRFSPNEPPIIIDHVKKTLNSADIGGILPTAAYDFHLATIGSLVSDLCKRHNLSSSNPPDLICVTRGPGMTGSLCSSTQFAKGLSVAWDVPLIGVHHMLGHLLIAQLPKSEQPDVPAPQYPFLSLLCSGGHTMLILSKSISEHEIIINVNDIAVGDSLDKCARELGLYGNMLGKELEKYINEFPTELKEEFHTIDVETRDNDYKFKLKMPFKGPGTGRVPKNIQFSFAQFLSSIQSYRIHYRHNEPFDDKTNKMIAYKTQETIFNHIIDRINVAFQRHGLDRSSYRNADGKFVGIKDFICSGGVAANRRLREKLSAELNYKDALRTNTDLTFHFPDLSLCTDNAVMIGVAGIEIFEKLRVKSDLSITPIRKWPMNELLDVDGWVKVDEEEFRNVCKF
ncbi:glycoprotease family-domain-containing protein [Scheffersomyces xylosifermentans]|uniref:glycoprotease family-domain-containing protein n=1 Tax=Scheffersomyces xylosifermentans TaxID=1304137 RepID=UPI00315D7967